MYWYYLPVALAATFSYLTLDYRLLFESLAASRLHPHGMGGCGPVPPPPALAPFNPLVTRTWILRRDTLHDLSFYHGVCHPTMCTVTLNVDFNNDHT